MTVANVIVVRVKDWLSSGKELPPWKTDNALCTFCGEDVIVTPQYAEMVKIFGFRVRYICTQCFLKQRVAG